MKAIVVGAGLAGLVAARSLHRAGWEVVVLEASDGIGGRVRTDLVDGFRLDRGLQALFTAYPTAQAQLDLKALKLRRFDAGVVIVEGGHWNEIGDPFKDVKSLALTAMSSLPTRADKLLAFKLRRRLQRQAEAEVCAEPDQTTEAFLRDYGFSPRFIDLFFRGLFGGIFMDRSLAVSSHQFLFDLKMLAQGHVAVPRDGMQAIPDQLALGLPEIHLETPALRLLTHDGRVVGVQTSTADLEADAVIVAAHAPEAERLTGIGLPKDAQSVTCLYFHLPHPLYGHKKLVINGYADRFVNHAVQITNIAPSYAPQPEHLLAAVILGAPDETVEQLTQQALRDMQRWFPWRSVAGLRALAAYQIPFAQLLQPPGFRQVRRANRTEVGGLYLAGEFTRASSMDGALMSGEKAAAAVLSDY